MEEGMIFILHVRCDWTDRIIHLRWSKRNIIAVNHDLLTHILCSVGGEINYCLLECGALWLCVSLRMFQRCFLSPSSRRRNYWGSIYLLNVGKLLTECIDSYIISLFRLSDVRNYQVSFSEQAGTGEHHCSEITLGIGQNQHTRWDAKVFGVRSRLLTEKKCMSVQWQPFG